MKIDNGKLDNLALQYNKGVEFALNNLCCELQSFVKSEAYKAVRRAKNDFLHIPLEDFVSAYNQAIWQAVKGFDGSSHYIQRLRTFMKFREADVWRQYQFQEDGEIKYDKARNAYLDEPMKSDDGESETLGDIVLGDFASPSAEEEVLQMTVILEAIEAYKKVKPKYYQVIKLLASEADNDEIAEAFGEPKYNGKIRILVYRSRNDFKKFLAQYAPATLVN